ncbi:MAG: hypothetical protein HC817_07280 [Saprospiraceae bacterium]|nr:hypothetical protein [Saprospiraceae bacterium]
MRFSFDNYNRQLVAAGLYASKISARAQGTFYIRLSPPQYETIKLMLNPFDDEFVTAFLGKKVTDNKGLTDLRVQEIVHRRDGGVLAIVEQVREVTRQMTNITGSLAMRSSGIRLLMDYFYDNFFAVSFSPDGTTHWKSIFYKKQMSQDDDARYSSYFLMKSTSALRFLYNDDVDRATTVSEYVLDAKGANEHNTIYNTDGQGINFRFRDALQVSVNEVLVPSEDRRRIKLVKIQY